jgi:hypothetical protein
MLTRDQIENATGRELDALIAEHVMGYSGPIKVRRMKKEGKFELMFKVSPVFGGFEFGQRFTEDGTKVYCGKPFNVYYSPSYSTDHNAAFEVVAALMARNPNQDIHLEHIAANAKGDCAEWAVSTCFDAKEGGFTGFVRAETLPLAICRASLLTIQGAAT